MINEKKYLFQFFILVLSGNEDAAFAFAVEGKKEKHFPVDILNIFECYCHSLDKKIIDNSILMFLRKFSFDVIESASLLSFLFLEKKISSAQVSCLIDFKGIDLDNLPPAIQELSNLLWLVRQDTEFDAKKDFDDAILENTMKSIRKEVLTQLANDI